MSLSCSVDSPSCGQEAFINQRSLSNAPNQFSKTENQPEGQQWSFFIWCLPRPQRLRRRFQTWHLTPNATKCDRNAAIFNARGNDNAVALTNQCSALQILPQPLPTFQQNWSNGATQWQLSSAWWPPLPNTEANLAGHGRVGNWESENSWFRSGATG